MTDPTTQEIEAAVKAMKAYARERGDCDNLIVEELATAALAAAARYRAEIDAINRSTDADIAAAAAIRSGPVRCSHEPYQGRCAHCDVPFKDGKPEAAAARSGPPSWNLPPSDPNVFENRAGSVEEGRSGPPESVEPVAWRVKDFADGWILYDNQSEAEHDARHMADNLVQPLYAAPPSEPQAVICVVSRLAHLNHCNEGDYAGSCKYGEDDTCPALRPSVAVDESSGV
jgi:hypothetical protein